jgi:predicted Zn-dependent protease
LLEAGRDALAGLVQAEPARPGLRLAYATTMGYLNEKDEAVRLTREAIANLPTLPPGDTMLMRLDAAYAYASAGAADLAVGELESYLAHPGEWSIEGIQRMPYLDPIREDPAFKKLVSKYARH